ncbi:MAG: DUF4910 domain-containing protein [Lachnospiraceae bacterium]|nr:DUF4910 domain-containing protein [Lachnospiraceae bacterium]
MNEGQRMYDLCCRIFPICRSIMGNGVRETFRILQDEISDIPFEMHEVPTGTQVLDWKVPKEWNIRDAYIETPDGRRICDFKENNLHVLHYSVPTDKLVSLSELKEHITTLKDQPDLIPYASSYYKERWGFCLPYRDLVTLPEGDYHAVIDSTLEPGSLTYGEILIPGESEEEVFFSSYTCHPSMANNECSGPSLIVALVRYLKDLPRRRYSYRLLLAPETIGALTYLSRNLDHMKKHVIAGFNLTCVGDNRAYSIIHSRYGDTLADKVLTNVLNYHDPEYQDFPYTARGSDERQYQAPGVDIPLVCFCRSKYHIYPEYHTSADNLDLISPEGLQGSFDVMVKTIQALEHNYYYRTQTLGEPQLGRRGLVPTMSSKETYQQTLALKDLIAYADGRNDLIDISNWIHVPTERLIPLTEQLLECGLFKEEER